jgi:hypothetical protein
MPEQSTKDEMNAAIRGARERHAVPRSMAPEPPPEPPKPESAPEPQPQPSPGLLGRLFGKK